MGDVNPDMEDTGSAPPNMDEARLRARISAAITAAGGVKIMVERTGIPKGTMEKYAAQTSTASFVNAAKIAASAGVTLDQIAFSSDSISINGGSEKLRAIAESISSRSERRTTVRRSKESGQLAPVDHPDQEDFIRLPIYDEVRASAGPGAVVTSERAEVVSFERAFLRGLGATPDRCSMIWARGDSMQPTIPDGSIIIIDHSQTDVVNGCIYVLNIADDLIVKRVRRRLDATIEIVSDNAMYPPESLRADQLQQLRVVGRVVYLCRTP